MAKLPSSATHIVSGKRFAPESTPQPNLIPMRSSSFHKPALKSIAIVGVSGHIGSPMARYIRYHAFQVRLHLIDSNPHKAKRLRAECPTPGHTTLPFPT